MQLGIDYLYYNNGLKAYIRKGWREHYEKMNLSPMKLLTCIERKMKAGKIPPHLKGTKVKMVNIDRKPKTSYFITL